MENKNELQYYNGCKVLNANKPFNFIVGSRSAGKSFYWKRYCIKKFLEKKRQFIYVRRYREDIERVWSTFYCDVQIKFENVIFETRGNELYINNELAGFAVSVSEFIKYKSVSFENVDTIFFDEFLSETKQYIGGKSNYTKEPELCLNFYQSVARGYNKPIREDVKFIFVANSVSTVNPYFSYFRISERLQKNSDILTFKMDGIFVEFTTNTSINSFIEETEFGKLIKQTNYGNYSLENEFYLDSKKFIGKINEDGLYIITLCYNGKKYGVRRHKNKNIFSISKNYDPNYPKVFSLDFASHNVNFGTLRKLKSDNIGKELIEHLNNGSFIVDTQETFQIVEVLLS